MNPHPVFSIDEIEKRISLARRASVAWMNTPPKQRLTVLRSLYSEFFSHQEEILNALTEDTGKPKFEALIGEFIPTLSSFQETLRHYKKYNEKKSLSLVLMKHRKSEIHRIPYGTILLIAPWNYPMFLSFADVFSSLMAGNAVLLKPSEFTSSHAVLIEKLFNKHLPEHLFQVFLGDGDLGAKLIQAKPDKIFFTGSVATGIKVSKKAIELGISTNMELGGKDAAIVLADADLDQATSAILWGALTNGGQSCASIERVIVLDSVYDKTVALLKEKLFKLNDQALTPPITNAQSLIYKSQLENALSLGLTLTSPLGSVNSLTEQQFLRPMPLIVEGAEIEKSKLYQEESFGPFIAILSVESEDKSIQEANCSEYGLTASIFSTNFGRATNLAKQLNVGTVYINETLFSAGLPETPWGGTKHSGNSRKHGPGGYLEYTRPLHVLSPYRPWLLKKSLWWFPYSDLQYKLFYAFSHTYAPRVGAQIVAGIKSLVLAVRLILTSPRL